MNNLNTTIKNYTSNEKCFQLQIPMNFEFIIPDNDSVRLLSQFVEEMDLTCLYDTYNILKENQVTPRQMLKILLYAYLDTKYASRVIETACKRDVNYMYLLEGKPAPDHATIARFRSLHFAPCAKVLLTQCTQLLYELGEISGENIFIDGTKMEANANKYTFVWKKSVGKWEEKMFLRIQEAVRLLNLEYFQSFTVKAESKTQDLQKIHDYLTEKCRQDGTVFVHGRGKRKCRNQKYLELFRRFLERQVTYDWHTASFQGRNNYCKTDPDATFMHMKDDHMRNAQLKPGYNVQIGVNSEYIVAADIFQDRNDVWTLIPFLKTMEEKLGFRYPSVTADSGYESEEGYTYLKEAGQKPYIKPQTYEKWKKRSFKQDISKRENMAYDESKDTYTCHAGKRLNVLYLKKQKSKSGYESEVTVYECENCTDCSYKEKCTRAKGNKRLYVSKSFLEKRQESYENILSETGILYRMNRSIQVEGAFGVLKNDYEFQRFLLREKTKVKLEILLLCMGYNLNKLHNKIQKNRMKSYFFDAKAS